MAYRVNVTTRAARDLALLFADISAGHSGIALEWYRGLKAAIFGLEQHPYRCPATRENPNLRHLLYGQKPNVYRVIYRVAEGRKRVDVLHIRLGARRQFKASDIG